MGTVLVTGSAGFIGRNLRVALGRRKDVAVLGYDVDSPPADLERHLAVADIVFHLAGVNRPKTEAEFATGNLGSTEELCAKLKSLKRCPRIVFTSSIQAAHDNPYGVSKRRAEEALAAFSRETGAAVSCYRLRNVFGKWCRPDYNSVVATFCHNIARGLPVQINDPARELELAYIDDVVDAFVGELDGVQTGFVRKEIPLFHKVTLGRLVELLNGFRSSRVTLRMPDFTDAFLRKLYGTYISYLPEDGFAYPLEKKSDARGDLAEFIKPGPGTQVFVSRTHPGITRGHHYHRTKTEKFLVLEGEAVIRFRHIEQAKVLEYPVNGREMKVVDIPPGYTHSIENVGKGEMVVLFWASEIFDPITPDTYPMTV